MHQNIILRIQVYYRDNMGNKMFNLNRNLGVLANQEHKQQ